ncbi:hypothetical protein F7D91_12495 [Prevotella copri]|nr:hypothetical protein [Segatella copri]MQM97043.1 hypothetical protein [Segatella copri]MQN05263.1 hypothetical protein [Segatella copri]MQN15170.1 hypothetical protein [Segatella copri]MQN19309.1 hypothetical protein [Segatella copri]
MGDRRWNRLERGRACCFLSCCLLLLSCCLLLLSCCLLLLRSCFFLCPSFFLLKRVRASGLESSSSVG